MVQFSPVHHAQVLVPPSQHPNFSKFLHTTHAVLLEIECKQEKRVFCFSLYKLMAQLVGLIPLKSLKSELEFTSVIAASKESSAAAAEVTAASYISLLESEFLSRSLPVLVSVTVLVLVSMPAPMIVPAYI
jgi:hypothetical protein